MASVLTYRKNANRASLDPIPARCVAIRGVVTRVALLIPICGVLGCRSSSQIVSPRVAGRVVEAGNHQPIQGVKVQRVSADPDRRSPYVQKGGQMMEQNSAVRTASDGTFMLDCIRDLGVFRKLGWYDVKVSFEHPGYERFTTTYMPTNAVITPEGIPVVNTGDVGLTPLQK